MHAYAYIQVDASTVLLYMSATASNGSQITAEAAGAWHLYMYM